jgi:hypothetical protein
MATTTPNYGWSVPTSSDLVKNGATAIETLGDSIDASMGELLGGTTGQVLSKTSNTSMDFTWTTPSGGSSNVAGKNGVLNSNFSIWQRGTSGTANSFGVGAGYNADRWQNYYAGTLTVSQQSTNDTTNLPFIRYCARVQRNLAQTNTGGLSMSQSIETNNSKPYAGKTVTFSFYARAGANYSATSNALGVRVQGGTGTDENVVFGYTGYTFLLNTTNTLTTTWQRFTHTFSVGSTYTELGVEFIETPTGVAGVNDYFEVTGVQLEIASSASAYSPCTSTQALELAACQRYYYRLSSPGSGFKLIAAGQFYSTTKAYAPITFPVTMRTSPTALDTTATASDYGLLGAAAGTNTMSSLPTVQSYTTDTANIEGTIASGGVGGNGTVLFFNGSAGYLGFSAEL